MKFTLPDGRIYRLSFRHILGIDKGGKWAEGPLAVRLDGIEERLGLTPYRLVGATECYLWPAGDPIPELPHGVAGCSEVDHYNHEKGRMVSLTEAVFTVFPRSEVENRRAVWTMYHTRGNRNESLTTELVLSVCYVGLRVYPEDSMYALLVRDV